MDFFNLRDWPVLPPDLSGGTEGLNPSNGHLLSVCISVISSWVFPRWEPRYLEDAALFRAPLSGRSRLQTFPSQIEPEETSFRVKAAWNSASFPAAARAGSSEPVPQLSIPGCGTAGASLPLPFLLPLPSAYSFISLCPQKLFSLC